MNGKNLRASVIVTTYNRARLVRRAISSALAAIRPGDEVIVIDDDSTDETEQVIAPLRDRIRYLKVSHCGAGSARNFGIKEAKNELICFLDSDDEWLPGQLELHRALMEARSDILFSFSNFMSQDDRQGRQIHQILELWRNGVPSWEDVLGPGVPFSSVAQLPRGFSDFKVHVGDLYKWELTDWYFSTITLVVRRSEAGDALYFAEDLPTYEDWVLCGLLARKGLAAYLDCETAVNHIHHGGARITDADAITRACAALKVFERVWGADDSFLRDHADLYSNTVAKWRIQIIKNLIAQGRTREARAEVRNGGVSLGLPYVALLTLPGVIAGPAARIASRARSLVSRSAG